MTREIKFRGRDVITGNWAYGYYYPSKGNHIIRDEKDNEHIVLKKTVGELTGLKDKNNKDIFEGDILKYELDGWEKLNDQQEVKTTKEYIAEVIFKDGYFCEEDDTPINFAVEGCLGEIIGNIHENK